MLPLASSLHVPLEDILGDLASMTVHGMSADQASQNLNDTLRHMINPTADQAKELSLLGLSAQQVAEDLQSKGLSGTLGEITDRITHLMPPGSDKVILDLKTALNGLPPTVQQLGARMADGEITMKEFIGQVKAGTPEAYEQAKSFLALIGQTHKLGNEQLTGKDVLQNYTQALRLATGDATGLNTAVLLTGENMGQTTKAIDTIKKASADASGDVKGWTEIQDTFNNKLDRTKEVFETEAIEIGKAFLPGISKVMDGFVGFVGDLKPRAQPLLDKAGAAFSDLVDDMNGLMKNPQFIAFWDADMRDVGDALTTVDNTLKIFKGDWSGLEGLGDPTGGVAAGIKRAADLFNPLKGALDGIIGALDSLPSSDTWMRGAGDYLPSAPNGGYNPYSSGAPNINVQVQNPWGTGEYLDARINRAIDNADSYATRRQTRGVY